MKIIRSKEIGVEGCTIEKTQTDISTRNIDGVFGALLCLTSIVAPPAILFALHHRLKRPNTRARANRRILVYCAILFILIGGLMTALVTSDQVRYADFGCRMVEYDDCEDIVAIAQLEIWLHSTFLPISENICFTGHDYACEVVKREVDLLVGDRWLLYGVFAILFAIPSVVLYFVLRWIYLKLVKQKRKNGKLKNRI